MRSIIYQLTPLILLICLTEQQQTNLMDGVINLLVAGERQFETEPSDIPMSKMLKEYDFIIVGAGTAGCTVANRLTENPDWNVLLLEAGRTENYLMDIPILANYLQFTESNWGFKTEPSDKFCLGMDNNQCNFPRGKVIGGSSVLNYMIYTRGNKKDYDNWARMGNKGWSYDEVLPYFKKIEAYNVPEFRDPQYHNSSGYLSVEYVPYRTTIADAFIKSSQQAGFKYLDYNGKSQVGVSPLQVSMRGGVRESAGRAYLHPIKNRKNLHVKKWSQVSRILIDPKTKIAYGVEFYKDKKPHIVKATKEVIVSSGAIGSPHLLMLSGIGPKKHLKSLDIPVLKNLKVGYNLMDHIATGGITFVIDKNIKSLRTDSLITKETLASYLNQRKGPMSVPGGCEAILFQDFNSPFDPDGHPDMELLFMGGSIISDPALRKGFGIREKVFKQVYGNILDEESYMIFPMLMKPKSKGRIMLKNTDWRVKPKIYPNYFNHKQDMETILKGINLILNITAQPALQALGSKLHAVPIAACAQYEFGSDDYFDCMTRQFTLTIYHQSGTCKMGPPIDKTAVVDPRLRVYGIKGLRVIDASIIPEIPAAHTNSPTYMIAEKGADMIKEDWHYNGTF